MVPGILLSSRLPPDKLVWACTTNGKFTVCNVYHLVMDDSRQVGKGRARMTLK